MWSIKMPSISSFGKLFKSSSFWYIVLLSIKIAHIEPYSDADLLESFYAWNFDKPNLETS